MEVHLVREFSLYKGEWVVFIFYNTESNFKIYITYINICPTGGIEIIGYAIIIIILLIFTFIPKISHLDFFAEKKMLKDRIFEF